MTGKSAERINRYGAFLMYVDDWLSSTAIALMTAAEERGYLRLLMHSWKSPDCGLPNDDKTLAQLSKLGGAWRGKSGDVLRAQFKERDGRLFNERLLRERQHQQEVRLSRSESSRKANAARWDTARNPSRNTNGSVSDPNPNPSPIDTNTDIDCLTTHHQTRDAPSGERFRRPSEIRQYPSLREVLRECFREEGQEDIYPSDRTVVDVMNAAGGAREQEVIAALRYLQRERGLLPGTRNGPRHWSWFPTVVGDYFSRKREREESANPCGHSEWEGRNEQKADRESLEAGMDAF